MQGVHLDHFLYSEKENVLKQPSSYAKDPSSYATDVGSLKQTIVVDSSCSAEFVASSIVCKQLLHAENMISFLGFSCPKPYRLYTDSLACYHIATNPSKLGNVRHLQIRFHLVRCHVLLGDVAMIFCVTEEMVADLFTKLVIAAQDARLTARFYTLLPAFASLATSNDFKGFSNVIG